MFPQPRLFTLALAVPTEEVNPDKASGSQAGEISAALPRLRTSVLRIQRNSEVFCSG